MSSKDHIADFTSWVRVVERRLDRLERLPRGGTRTGAVARIAVQNTTRGWSGIATFEDGVAYTPIPSSIMPMGALAGFDAVVQEFAAINVSVEPGRVKLLASISDGDYPVTILFFWS